MVEEFVSEVARRREAVELVEGGMSKAETGRRLGRSRRWVVKWVSRFNMGGDDGLYDLSRVPKTQPTKTPPAVVAEVLAVRGRLEDDPVASIGALSILASLERDGFSPLPSIATIERILSRAGVATTIGKPQRSGVKLPLPVVATPGEWQQADWIQDRYLKGGIRFQSLQVADVGSHGVTSGQYFDRKVLTAVTFLVENAWPILSIPQAMGTDNAFVKTTHRNNPFTMWVRVCLYFGVEVIISPPGRHGWTNHIEAVNNLWQDRTIWAQRFANLDGLRAGSDRACEWFNTKRPILDPARCGTRYPAEFITRHQHQLRWPPSITIADHLDSKGKLNIPISHGRITFLRHVSDHHTINVAHQQWPVPETIPIGGLVTATITTTEHKLTIRHQGEPAATMTYPIKHPVQDPYHTPANTSLLTHV